MRRLVVGLALGMMVPALSAAQTLGPRTLLPMHVACAELPVTAPPVATLRIDGVQRADGRQALAPGTWPSSSAGPATSPSARRIWRAVSTAAVKPTGAAPTATPACGPPVS